MFSLDNFYYVLYKNFLQPHGISNCWFNNFGSVDPEELCLMVEDTRSHVETKKLVLYYDQEPLIENFFNKILIRHGYGVNGFLSNKYGKILANSEHSQLKNDICKKYGFLDWYYFFHGLIALEWYRDYKYIPKLETSFTKVFICLNHLVTKDRSYRLNLVANLLDQELVQYGHVSCSLDDGYSNWFDELFKNHSQLSKDAKKLIYKKFSELKEPLRVDTYEVHGNMSAKLNLPLQQDALWHVVTETIFYHDKLHLTEKIFKPIVARRPFILVGAPNNLAYLKSYGFKTFDRWIDESYDSETDPDKRIAMIVEQIKKLCELTPTELNQMYQEMQDILDYNHDHFYSNFKRIVIEEMIANFDKCVKQLNVGLGYYPERRVDPNAIDYQALLYRLMQ